MKKIVLLLILSMTSQVNFAKDLVAVEGIYYQEEQYNVARYTEYSQSLIEYLALDAGQQAAAKANIKRYLIDKAILDKSVSGLSQKEYNYRLEKLKIELTYKLQTTLNSYQRQQLDNIRKTAETAAVAKIKHMLFV